MNLDQEKMECNEFDLDEEKVEEFKEMKGDEPRLDVSVEDIRNYICEKTGLRQRNNLLLLKLLI